MKICRLIKHHPLFSSWEIPAVFRSQVLRTWTFQISGADPVGLGLHWNYKGGSHCGGFRTPEVGSCDLFLDLLFWWFLLLFTIGKSQWNHNLREWFLRFSKHLKQIQVHIRYWTVGHWEFLNQMFSLVSRVPLLASSFCQDAVWKPMQTNKGWAGERNFAWEVENPGFPFLVFRRFRSFTVPGRIVVESHVPRSFEKKTVRLRL